MRDFNHTVGVLVKAYMNNTLEHTNCYACAVGNIIADSLGLGYCRRRHQWHELQWESEDIEANWYTYLSNGGEKENAIRQINSTGYSVSEIRSIEMAFEKCGYDDNNDQWMFNGLMAVVDVLAEIHEIDLTQREEAKLLFVKA